MIQWFEYVIDFDERPRLSVGIFQVALLLAILLSMGMRGMSFKLYMLMNWGPRAPSAAVNSCVLAHGIRKKTHQVGFLIPSLVQYPLDGPTRFQTSTKEARGGDSPRDLTASGLSDASGAISLDLSCLLHVRRETGMTSMNAGNRGPCSGHGRVGLATAGRAQSERLHIWSLLSQ